jgi:hypothetical protein
MSQSKDIYVVGWKEARDEQDVLVPAVSNLICLSQSDGTKTLKGK